MNDIFFPLLIFSIVTGINIFRGTKIDFKYFFNSFVMLMLLFLFFFMTSKLHGELIVSTKWELIQESERHKELANEKLKEAKRICWWIPELDKREHLERLIGSVGASTLIKDPKDKFLAIAMTLISSLAESMYSNYISSRKVLSEAAFHLEMAYFYDKYSMKLTDEIKMDEGTKYYLQAIDFFTLAEMFAMTIHNQDQSYKISKKISKEKEYLINQFKNPCRYLPYEVYFHVESFEEKIQEYLDEIDDGEICMAVGDCLWTATECIGNSYVEWEKFLKKRNYVKF